MRIHKPEKSWIDKEVKKKFAFIPLRYNTEEIMWLEWYYYYDDTRFFWRGPCRDFKDKEDFLERGVGKGERVHYG